MSVADLSPQASLLIFQWEKENWVQQICYIKPWQIALWSSVWVQLEILQSVSKIWRWLYGWRETIWSKFSCLRKQLSHNSNIKLIIWLDMGKNEKVTLMSGLITDAVMRPDSVEGGRETPIKDETSEPGRLTKDKVHVEELRLPEIMIPVTKSRGNENTVFFSCLFTPIVLQFPVEPNSPV